MKIYKKIRDKLSDIEYVIKAGKIIKHNDQVDLTEEGKILWASGKAKKQDVKLFLKRKEDFFQKYNSLFLNSYSALVNDSKLRKVD